MNHTNSGAIACGHEMSLARFASEARQARENQYQLLLLTPEGMCLLSRFAQSVGCDFNGIHESNTAGEWIDKEAKCLFSFLCAIEYAFSKV